MAEAGRAHRVREGAVLDVARRPQLRPQPGAVSGRFDPRRRSGVRRRLLARARRLGDPAGRFRRRDRAQLLRHLPQQLHEERARAGRTAGVDGAADLGRDRGRPGDRDRRRRRATDRRGPGRRHHRRVPVGRADPTSLPRRTRRRRHHARPTPARSTTTRRTARPGWADAPRGAVSPRWSWRW